MTDEPKLTVVNDESVDLGEELGIPDESDEKVSKLPEGISWPEDFVKANSVEEIQQFYSQVANKAISDFVGSPTFLLFQFASPTSIQFGIRASEPKPSNEAMIAVLSRIVRELETLHRVEIEEQRIIGIQQAIEDSSELVDQAGLPVVAPNREQKRHPEKFGLTRRQKSQS